MGGLGILVFLVTRAGRDLAGALGNINFPSIGDIKLPEINLPNININTGFEDAQKGFQEQLDNLSKSFNDFISGGFGGGSDSIHSDDPPFGGQPIEEPVPSGETEFATKITQDAQGNVTTTFRDIDTGDVFIPAPEPIFTEDGLNVGDVVPRDIPRTIDDFRNQNQSVVVQSEINNQQFQGGGISFGGGVVRETPIENLSLGQIIDRFNVTASQAADIRARASNDFGDFDFGTNTGSGIGSVVAEDEALRSVLPNNGAVSNPQFEGLSAEEIARRLTGGVINNF